MGPAFVETLPVAKFHGVGPATTAKMHRLGIETGLVEGENSRRPGHTRDADPRPCALVRGFLLPRQWGYNLNSDA
jgi:hypothetical protein